MRLVCSGLCYHQTMSTLTFILNLVLKSHNFLMLCSIAYTTVNLLLTLSAAKLQVKMTSVSDL